MTIDQCTPKSRLLSILFIQMIVETFSAKKASGIRRGCPMNSEARLLGQTGSTATFCFVLNPLKDAQGYITRWYGTATDIEDRKRAEEKIRRRILLCEKKSTRHPCSRKSLAPLTHCERSFATSKSSTDRLYGSPHRRNGNGQRLIARAIHKISRRSSRAFVSVNCAAIPQSLIGSELLVMRKGHLPAHPASSRPLRARRRRHDLPR